MNWVRGRAHVTFDLSALGRRRYCAGAQPAGNWDPGEGSGELCRRLLEALPEWFGVPKSNDRYADTAEHALTVIARVDEREVGLLTLIRHTPVAAEIDVMAVAPEYPRRGIGRALLARAEQLLARDGVEFLQVKALSDSANYEPYARTRAFYRACGVRALQEFPNLWDAENPALQFIQVHRCQAPGVDARATVEAGAGIRGRPLIAPQDFEPFAAGHGAPV